MSIDDIVKSFYIEYSTENIDFVFGNIYTVYGRGLSLYSFNDRDIDYDNSIMGASVFYSKSIDNAFLKYIAEDIECYSLFGSNNFKSRSNPADKEPNLFIDNDLFVSGITLYKDSYDLYYSFHFNKQYVGSATITEM